MALTSNTLAAGLTAEETSSQANDLIYSERAGTGHKITRDNFLGVIVAQLAADTTPSQARTTLGVPVLSDDETLADASATQSVSERAVKVYVDGFTSTAQTITVAGLLTLAHGLPSAPGIVQARLVCNDAGGDNGYAQNDVIHVGPGFNGTEIFRRGFAVFSDATNVYIRFGDSANVVYYPNKTTGAWGPLTDSKWDFYVEARV